MEAELETLRMKKAPTEIEQQLQEQLDLQQIIIRDSLASLRTEMTESQSTVLQNIVADVTTITEGVHDLANNPPKAGNTPDQHSDSLFDSNLFMFSVGLILGFIAVTIALNWMVVRLGKQD